MVLDKNINYIVSGLTRSGTSMLMQILDASGLSISFDNKRSSDPNNPKGYYELEGGKIINKLMTGTFPLEKHKGKFVKITSYGLNFLPLGNYKIIYSERNIEEILDSMEKMMGNRDNNREETKEAFMKLNNTIKNLIKNREDIEFLLVNYNNILLNPCEDITRICNFLNLPDDAQDKMINVIDKKLYRQKREK